MTETAPAPARTTYVLVDGENIDATLGGQILQRRPHPDERPRWDRVLRHAEQVWGQPVSGLFFLAATNGDMPMTFVQALMAMDYKAIPLSGDQGVKVVDIAIQRTLTAIADREADVMLLSHDRDFYTQVEALCDGSRRVALVGFREFRSTGFAGLEEKGLVFFDLEHDVDAFNSPLPRLRVIPIEEFDPNVYL